MATARERSVGDLARDAANDVTAIARNEIRLANAEISENLKSAANGVTEMLYGLAFLIPALTMALIAAGYGLATVDGVPEWGAFLIVAGVALLIGVGFLLAGRGDLRPRNIFPKKSARNLKRDARTLKEAV